MFDNERIVHFLQLNLPYARQARQFAEDKFMIAVDMDRSIYKLQRQTCSLNKLKHKFMNITKSAVLRVSLILNNLKIYRILDSVLTL